MMMLQITKLISFILADTTDKQPQFTGFSLGAFFEIRPELIYLRLHFCYFANE